MTDSLCIWQKFLHTFQDNLVQLKTKITFCCLITFDLWLNWLSSHFTTKTRPPNGVIGLIWRSLLQRYLIMANTFPTAKTPQVNQQYEFSKRNPCKFSEKTSFSQRLLATTSSASPLKVKSKFLVWLGSKNKYRYGGISNEILNTGTGFFYLRNPRLRNAGHSLTNPYKLSPCHLQITTPYLESGTHAVKSRNWHFVGFLTLDDIAVLISLLKDLPTQRHENKW